MPKENARRSVKVVVNNQLKLGLVKATSEDIIMTMKMENARSLSMEDVRGMPIISKPKQSVQKHVTFTPMYQVGPLHVVWLWPNNEKRHNTIVLLFVSAFFFI